MKKIAFIGVGIMGKSMVRNLMKAGFELHIFARTRAKVEDVISEGAVFHGSIAECVKGAEVVITMVGFPADVEQVYFEANAILDSADKGAYLIDMTTTSPRLSKRIYEAGTARGFKVLDAPVTGGDTGARNGTLAIFVGGDRADYDACLPLFEAMGTNINYQGGPGAGQHVKAANQIMVAGAISGVCEAIAYARAQGLDENLLVDSTATGSAASRQLDTLGKKVVSGDYAPGFFVKHIVKDMGIALQEAEERGLELSMLRRVYENYKELESRGFGDLGTQALIKNYIDKK